MVGIYLMERQDKSRSTFEEQLADAAETRCKVMSHPLYPFHPRKNLLVRR
jgi:hypothetical protein